MPADDLNDRLHRNRQKRTRAEFALVEARDELATLLVEGAREGRKVAPMARAAGVSRETAHRLIREWRDNR
jgi:hypothetical protein